MARLGTGQPSGVDIDLSTPVEQLTTADLLEIITNRIDASRAQYDGMPAGREFALALTTIEEIGWRVTRGVAMANGIFNQVDLEKDEGLPRARENFEADH